MSAVSKGNAYEIEVKKTLESYGWKVFRQHRKPLFMPGKFGKPPRMITIGADIFGSDLVCKMKGTKTLWVQVSTPENLSAKKTQMTEHPINTQYENYEIWSRVSGKKEFEIHRAVTLDTGSVDWIKMPTVKARTK